MFTSDGSSGPNSRSRTVTIPSERTNRGWRPPIGEAYGAIEGPGGELGFYFASDGRNAAYRARCRPTCFINYQIFPEIIRGHQLSDVVAILGSIQVIAAELDR